jgi:quercetin dioxygenase-like cupin family protein
MTESERAVVRPAGDVPANKVAAGTATQMQVLVGPDQGAPNFVLRRFIMDAGGGMPLHTNQVEHEQYVLRGRARITVGTAVHEVGPDHTLYIPAGTPHSYQVLQAPFEFLCVVPNGPDRITVIEGGARR